MKKYWIFILILLAVGVGIYLDLKGQIRRSARTENNFESVVGADPSISPIIGQTPGSARTENKGIKNKVAFMADIHNDMDSLDAALKLAKQDGVKVVIVAGDLTINGTRDELIEVMAHLGEGGVKYFAVPGNHDLYNGLWGGVFGKEYQSFKLDNIKYILINNGNWRGLGVDQKSWIEGEVKECLLIKCVAVMHMPLLNNFSKHVMGEYNAATLAEAGWLKNLLLKNNVKTGYSGHLHYNSDYTIDGWETILVGAISKDRNTETPRFTEMVIYDDGTVENKLHVLEN